jgi:branched-chain amino acid transport system ATP-binding protein
MPLLSIRNLSKYFGGLAANSDVSFDLEAGMIMGLIGPNGAGKTTLFNCITGFQPPDKGEILLDGRRINGKRPDEICHYGMVRTWQRVRPLPRMTVLENVMVGALCRTNSLHKARKISQEKIRIVGLEKRIHQRAGSLPIGERKRLEVARVLATDPKLLLLDEVMGGLNPTESEKIILLILRLRDFGITPMVIEHDMKAIMRISDRIVVLNSGEKLAEGSPQEIASSRLVIDAYLGESDA